MAPPLGRRAGERPARLSLLALSVLACAGGRAAAVALQSDARSRVPAEPPKRVAESGLPVRGWRVLDFRNTFEVLGRGAGLLRIQEQELRWIQDGPVEHEPLRALLRSITLGEDSAPPGACLAVDDVLSAGWTAQLASQPVAAGAGADAAASTPSPRHTMQERAQPLAGTLVQLKPLAGFLCNAWVLQASLLDPSRASKFEMQELWARTFRGRRLLLVVGERIERPDVLSPVLRDADGVAVRHLHSRAAAGDLAGSVQELSEVVAESAFDMVVVAGFDVGIGTILSALLDRVVQTVDAGDFDVLPPPLRRPAPAVMTTVSRGVGAASAGVVDGLAGEPWGGPGFHPRPHLRRPGLRWVNLNGPWDAFVALATEMDAPAPDEFVDGTVVVPFPAESASSGFGRSRISEFEILWLRREVVIPPEWPRVLLHFEACDWECSVYIDRQLVGTHRGGYDAFALDVTEALLEAAPGGRKGSVEVLVRVWDPTDSECEYVLEPPVPCKRCCETGWQPRGKQTLSPGFIMYNAASGPWMSIWMEEHRAGCRLASAAALLVNGPEAVAGGDADVRVEAALDSATGPCAVGMRLRAVVRWAGEVVASHDGDGPFAVAFRMPASAVHLWSPDTPSLYQCTLTLCDMALENCGQPLELDFGLRWLSVSGPEDVGPREERELLLNGDRLFQHGVLYQAYWPESLITAPSHTALTEEVQKLKDAGFNMVRVHVAVMPALFYQLCDRLGVLVWQDFPAGDMRSLPIWDAARGTVERNYAPLELDEIVRGEESEAAYWRELQAMVAQLSTFTSVVCWIPFNEGWGQFDTMKVVRWLRQFGGGRWIDATSGWNDVGDLHPGEDAGDLVDLHNYEGPPFHDMKGTFANWPQSLANRALALGEYGGLGLPVDGHETFPEMSWAYGKVSRTSSELAERILALGGRLAGVLCENRVSAAVYTQWNDIETEVNGLVTYDRVLKLPLETFREFAMQLKDAHRRCQPR